MDTSKVTTSNAVQPSQPTKRVQADETTKPKVPVKPANQTSAYDAPRQTVNSQGQAIGTQINYRA
jgi:hypothetical protein